MAPDRSLPGTDGRAGRGGRWSIAQRLVWRLCLVLGALWAVAVGTSVVALRHEIDEVYDGALEETAERLLPLAADHLRRGPPAPVIALPRAAAGDEYSEFLIYQLRDAAGRVLLHSQEAPATAFSVPLVPGLAQAGGRPFYTAVTAGGDLFLQVTEPPGHRAEALTESLIALVLPLLLLVPAAGLVVRWSVRDTLDPLRRIGDEFRRRDGGNLAPLHEPDLPDELAPIMRDVNRLFERLRQALEGERSFAANAAHELRTPVAAALAQAQRLGAQLESGPRRTRAEQIAARLRRLANLVEKLLQLARAEAGIALAREPVDLLPVLRLVVEDHRRRPDLGDRLQLDDGGLETLPARLDIDAFGIVLGNLLDNAASHGARDQPIVLSLAGPATIRLRNGGPAVTSALLPRLGRRFQRGVTEAPGAGLGLAIVASIVAQAGGVLRLRSPLPGRVDGFEAELVLGAG